MISMAEEQVSQGQQMTPEQQAELQKKLENMSPEELREFQKQQCIFCHIISGKVAARKVYEDDKTIAVLDINPANPGHILLFPKEHYMIMPQLPEDELKHIFVVAKHLSNALLRALDVKGTNMIVANGPAAGQRAQHFMIHIIPRKDGDGVEFTVPSKERPEDELEQVLQSTRKKLNELLGLKEQEQKKTAKDILNLKAPEKEIVEAEFEEKKESEEVPEDENNDEKEEVEDKNDEKDEEEPEDDNSDKIEDESDDEDKKEGEIDLDSIARVLNG